MTAPAPLVPCQVDQLPAELRAFPQWVAWKLEPAPDRPKPVKVPYGKSGRRARANEPGTWLPLEAATALAASDPSFAGLGFYFFRGDPFTGVDLDDVRDPATGVLTERAARIVSLLSSYTEVSQSGTGVHVVVRGRATFAGDREGGKLDGVEVYSGKHYLALTGARVPGTPAGIEDRQAELDQLLAELTGGTAAGAETGAAPATPANPGAPLTDEQVIAVVMRGKDAKRWFALYAGGEVAPGRLSEADFELASILCRATDDDDQVARIMLTSPLKRDKWAARRGSEAFLQYTVRSARTRLRGGATGKGGADRALSLRELSANPDLFRAPEAVVPGLAWAGRLTLVAAREGLGKSTLFAAAAAAVTAGEPLVRGGAPCPRGPVLWCLVEEHLSDLALRARLFGTDEEQLFVLDRPGDGVGALRAEAARLGPKLIVVDTLHAFAAGVVTDASAADQWQPLLTALDDVARTTGAAVLVAAQASRQTGDYRDSTAIGHGVDVVLTLAKQKDASDDDPVRDLLVRKARWKLGTLRVKLAADGRSYERLDRPDPGQEARDLEDRILRFVAAAVGRGQKVTKNAICDAVGGKRTTVQQRVDELVTDGRLTYPDARTGYRTGDQTF